MIILLYENHTRTTYVIHLPECLLIISKRFWNICFSVTCCMSVKYLTMANTVSSKRHSASSQSSSLGIRCWYFLDHKQANSEETSSFQHLMIIKTKFNYWCGSQWLWSKFSVWGWKKQNIWSISLPIAIKKKLQESSDVSLYIINIILSWRWSALKVDGWATGASDATGPSWSTKSGVSYCLFTWVIFWPFSVAVHWESKVETAFHSDCPWTPLC